jgi:FkbM family methyltransferase
MTADMAAPHPFDFLTPQEADVFHYIVTANEYQLPDRFPPDSLVIDIGANIGIAAYACLARGAGKVLAFEAVPGNAERCTAALAGYGDGIDVRNLAVWRSDVPPASVRVTAPPWYDGWDGTGVTVMPRTGNQIEVASISLDAVLLALQRRVNLLKIDCEGAEWPILLTSTRLDQIDAMVGEYHEIGFPGAYYPDPVPAAAQVNAATAYRIADLVAYLAGQGFLVRYYEHVKGQSGIGLFFATRKNQ